MFPVVQILERALLPKQFGGPYLDTALRNLLRALLVVFSVAAAISIPLFGLFASFVGTFSNSFIAFIFPPVAYLKLFYPKGVVPVWKLIACIVVLIIGLIGMGVGSTIIIKDIVTALASSSNSTSC
jgi:hypothetical protein